MLIINSPRPRSSLSKLACFQVPVSVTATMRLPWSIEAWTSTDSQGWACSIALAAAS